MLASLKIRLSLAIIFLSFCLGVLPVAALEVPALAGRINDHAGMLSSATVAQLDGLLADLEAKESTQIVVLTVPSLEQDSLEDFSLRVVEAWKIGQQDIDNGALLLVARDDRKIRIEVGYGMEGELTDAVSGQIIRNYITPRFRQGDFNQGVIDGVGAMVAVAKGQFTPATKKKGRKRRGDLGSLLIAAFFFMSFFGSMFRKHKVKAGIAGGLAAPVLGYLFMGLTGLTLLALLPVGFIGGLLASISAASSGSGRRSGHGGFYMGSGGGFGGSSGGFSGGGGSFGGGGASGGW